ncbi:unnamed protein product [Rhizophagus irregularis]|nr:unnamed protein product [Rhizophagus irregularis]
MTSLIFMLPETMCPILDYIRYDTKSLYSCMFVNRTWCSLTTPILWRAPFKESRSSLITTFIRCLDRTSKGKKRNLLKSNIYYLDMLIERIMSKAKRLSELSIPTVTHRKGDYVCLIKHSSAAKKCLPTLRYLICDNCIPKNLLFASEFCINLNRLDIDCSWINDREVSKFLKAQKNLKQLTVTKRWPQLNDAISIDNLSISLRCVVLKDNCHRQNGGTLSVLKSFTNLEILRFHNWASFPENDIEGLTSCYFPRLRKLSFTHCKPTAGMIIPMILINGSSLQELTLSWEINQSDQYSVIRTIASNCPNLEYLDVPIVRKDVSNLHYVLKSCKKLESLTINSANDDDYDVDNFFPSMGNIIPEPLYQLNIFASWKFTAESLSEFLKNCKNNLSCLGFYRSATDEHLKVITEYANEREIVKFPRITLV